MMTHEDLMIKNKDASPWFNVVCLACVEQRCLLYKYSRTKQIIFHISEAFHWLKCFFIVQKPEHNNEIHPGNRRSHLRHWQGHHCKQRGYNPQVMWPACDRHQDRPIHQHRCGHIFALWARWVNGGLNWDSAPSSSPFICIDHAPLMLSRRGVRAGRRRRGGPGSGKLRAFPRHSANQRQQLDHRQDLSVGHQQGEERRLPGQDCSG